MRDKNRIRPFLDKFAELWEKYPDSRFGQLVSAIEHEMKMEDTFYVEEEKWLDVIKKMIDKE